MALNFPANTSLPYIDPVSQLKYIYNPAVGAWEAAIQPPAVIADAPPALNIPGFLWWDNVSGSLYIWYQDEDSGQWVDATAAGSVGLSTAYIGEEPPVDPVLGELWWDCDDGRLYIYYDDGGSKQWIQATTGSNGETVVNYGIKGSAGATAPTAPGLYDLWYNTTERSLYLYVRQKNKTAGEWLKASAARDPDTYVDTITAGSSILLSGTAREPIVAVQDASFTSSGAIRIATVGEVREGVNNQVAISPGVLKESITAYLPSAGTNMIGAVQLATPVEVAAGTVDNKAITPKTLNDSLKDLGLRNVTGTIIDFASATAPTGYLKCDGSVINRLSYMDLFQVIGTTFGIGDGTTTFAIPNLSSGNTGIFKYIKF